MGPKSWLAPVLGCALAAASAACGAAESGRGDRRTDAEVAATVSAGVAAWRTSVAQQAPSAAPAPQLSPTPQPLTTPSPRASATPAGAPEANVGEAVVGRNWEYRVEETRGYTGAGVPVPSKPRGNWIVVVLTVKNTGKTNVELNPWDFELHDGEGNKYRADVGFGAHDLVRRSGLDPLGGRYPPGVPVRTAVVFDTAPKPPPPVRLLLVQEDRFVHLVGSWADRALG